MAVRTDPAYIKKEEEKWLQWLRKVRESAITPAQAARKMGVTERWVRELLSERS